MGDTGERPGKGEGASIADNKCEEVTAYLKKTKVHEDLRPIGK